MGFVKDAAVGAAKLGTFGLAGALLSNKKKKNPLAPTTAPSMISSPTTVTPMIGGTRGGY